MYICVKVFLFAVFDTSASSRQNDNKGRSKSDNSNSTNETGGIIVFDTSIVTALANVDSGSVPTGKRFNIIQNDIV